MTACALYLLTSAQGQNLVLNGSFEEYNNCPTSFGQWTEVTGWTSPYNHSADYFNACAESVLCSVPFNNMGYQYAADGDAYMGLATYSTIADGFYREVIATELIQPLEPGVPVYISFMASPGGFGSSPINSAHWKARGPGTNFFIHLPTEWHDYLFPNSAAVEMSTVLEDTASWTTISGVFIPDSAYSYLAITGYFENEVCSASILDSTGVFPCAYSFIDNVSVSTTPTYCHNCSALIRPAVPEFLVSNPFAEFLTMSSVASDMNGTELMLLDLTGRICWYGSWPLGQPQWSLAVPGLPSGSYLLQWTKPKTFRKAMKVIHVSP